MWIKPHHRANLWATLETIDKMLETQERQLGNENNTKDVLSLIHVIRNDISRFLHEFGIIEEQRDKLWDLLVSCSFIKNYLVDLEPERFQRAYGKFDSEDNARRLEHLKTGVD